MSEFDEDFDDIRVTEANQREEGWTFLVELGHGEGLIEYFIDVDKDYWTRLTSRRVEPADLVRETFRFLLDKQPKEVILKRFNIAEVAGQFPVFEHEIKRTL